MSELMNLGSFLRENLPWVGLLVTGRVGGDSMFILKDLGNVAGFFDVTGQSDYARSFVNLDVSSDEYVRTQVKSARDEALMECRWRNPVVDRKPSFFMSWTGERLELPARGLLSRVMGNTSRSRAAFPPFSLACEAALPRDFSICTTIHSHFQY